MRFTWNTSNDALTTKTPGRWAKRQSIMALKSVTVKIEQMANQVVVSNNLGRKWRIPFEDSISDDDSARGIIADVSSAFLTGTINSHLCNTDAKTLLYTLTVVSE